MKLQILFYFIVLLAGFLNAIILTKLCSDEIEKWKNWLMIVCVFSLAGIIINSLMNFEYKLPITASLFFIIITNLEIIRRSYSFDRK